MSNATIAPLKRQWRYLVAGGVIQWLNRLVFDRPRTLPQAVKSSCDEYGFGVMSCGDAKGCGGSKSQELYHDMSEYRAL
jgi:hypothetical protein